MRLTLELINKIEGEMCTSKPSLADERLLGQQLRCLRWLHQVSTLKSTFPHLIGLKMKGQTKLRPHMSPAAYDVTMHL